MVKVPDEAKVNELAEFYAETVSDVVTGVIPQDYQNFTKLIEKSKKSILITPINFIVYLTGISPTEAHDYYLKNKSLDNLLPKRKDLIGEANEV